MHDGNPSQAWPQVGMLKPRFWDHIHGSPCEIVLRLYLACVARPPDNYYNIHRETIDSAIRHDGCGLEKVASLKHSHMFDHHLRFALRGTGWNEQCSPCKNALQLYRPYVKLLPVTTLVIQSILHLYKQASGQNINNGNTNIFFSSNTLIQTQEVIITFLGVPEIQRYEQDLGFPSLVGHAKKKSFNIIKERIWKKLNRWKEKLLS